MASRAEDFARAMEAARAMETPDRPVHRRWPLICETTDDGMLAITVGNKGKPWIGSQEDALALRDFLTEVYDDAAADGKESVPAMDGKERRATSWRDEPLPGVRPMREWP